MTTVEVLKLAREKVAGGWCKGHYVKTNPDGKDAYCVAGAISRSGVAGKTGHAYEIFSQAIGSGLSLSAWNDAPNRTKEEVLAAFDKAILLAEAESKPGAAAS